MRIYLTGPNAGKDKVLMNVRFVSGIAELSPGREGLAGMLGSYYSAYPEGSAELEEALNKFGGKEVYGGTGLVSKDPAGDSSGVQPTGKKPAEKAATGQPVDAPTSSGSAGSVAKGDGQTDARVDSRELVEQACMRLDPTDATHWYAGGKPKLAVVVQRAGVGGREITRTDLKRHGLLRNQVADRQDK